MATKYKATGCSRFFFFLIIFVPVVYFGLKYLNDNGQLDTIRDKIEQYSDENAVDRVINRKNEETTASSETENEGAEQKIRQLLDIVEKQRERIDQQEGYIEQLEGQIKKLQSEDTQETIPASDPESTDTKNPTSDGEKVPLEELLKEAEEAIKKNG
jgi:septal ring factor EnvC (AmiA/AmiB activator)